MKINGVTVLSALATTTNYVLKQSSTAGTLINSQIFDNGTNVGIGTTSPANKLQISSTDSSNQLLRLGIQYNSIRDLRGGINWHDGANTTGQISTEYDGTMVSMVFGSLYNSGYNSNSLMTIRGNGSVGIGITSPSEKLEVQSGAAGAKIKVSNSGGGSASLEISSNASSVAQLNFTNQLSLIGGNVGIGTTSPETSSLLDLNSITQGFLAPRMRTSERDSIGSPANGLIIFNTDSETIDVFTNGGGWKSVLFL